MNWVSKTVPESERKRNKVIQSSKRKQVSLFFNFASWTKQSEMWFLPFQLQSENVQLFLKFCKAKGISPRLKVKRIGVYQKFAKIKQNEVKPFRIVQDRRGTSLLVIVKKRKYKKYEYLVFFL